MPFKSFFCLFAVLLALMSCDDNAINDTSSVSGRFVTEDGKAIEGALVRVFTVKPMDTLVMRLRRDYKNVGCDISDATEFDHRFYGKPLAEGHTDSDGKFSFDNLSGGPYHISVTHPEYSWRYVYRTSGILNEIRTTPVIKIKGTIPSNQIWDNPRQDYVITSNTVQNGGSLTIKSGTRIRLEDQRRFTIQNGELSIQGTINNPVWITSNTDSNNANYSSGIHLLSSQIKINHGIFTGGSTGLNIVKCSGDISESYFTSDNTGLLISQCSEELKIGNLVISDNLSDGMRIELSSVDLNSVIFYQSKHGLSITQESKVKAYDCYFQGEETGANGNKNSNIIWQSCEFSSKRSALTLNRCKGAVINSVLYGDIPISIISANGSIEHSNLFPISSLIALLTRESAPDKLSVYFDSCYFDKCTSLAEIFSKIPIDQNDELIIREIINPVFSKHNTIGLIQ